MAGGITFSAAAPMICGVCDNGIDANDPRVMIRVNEATKIVLDQLIPVGGQATYDVVANGTTLLLPPQLENAIEVEVLNKATVRGDTDVTQGFFSLVSDSQYVDPGATMDNPLVDQGLVPDPIDNTILRRQYDYPGLQPNATVRVIGAKRYIPITSGNDYLIVQNIEALKLIILSIERYENNAPDDAMKYRQAGLELLAAEVKKHLLDPQNAMKRKAAYEDDMVNFSIGSFGWTRARIALEVPGALQQGKLQLTRVIEMAERRLMEKGTWKNTLKSYTADVQGGFVYFPRDVENVIAADLCGQPIEIKSEFYEYNKQGHCGSAGKWGHWHTMMIDEGEEYFPASRVSRRKYKLHSSWTNVERLSVIAKIRWQHKSPNEQMVIKNFEAIRLMSTAIMDERKEQWQQALVNQQQAIQILDDELREFMGGQTPTPKVNFGFWDSSRHRRSLL